MFTLAQSDSYSWPIEVEFPVDGGKTEKQTFDARIKRLSQTRLEELQASIASGMTNDRGVAGEILVGWAGVVDASNQEIPFSVASKKELLDQARVATAVVAGFFDSLSSGKRKN